MMRILPHLLCLLGLVVLVAAFGRWCGASIPYQDATPDLLAIQRERTAAAGTAAAAGAALFIAGVAWLIVRRRWAAAS